MRKAKFLRRLKAAESRVQSEIAGNAQGGKFASGLSSEGYAGGYMAALHDVEAMLTHGYPTDSRGYWATGGDE